MQIEVSGASASLNLQALIQIVRIKATQYFSGKVRSLGATLTDDSNRKGAPLSVGRRLYSYSNLHPTRRWCLGTASRQQRHSNASVHSSPSACAGISVLPFLSIPFSSSIPLLLLLFLPFFFAISICLPPLSFCSFLLDSILSPSLLLSRICTSSAARRGSSRAFTNREKVRSNGEAKEKNRAEKKKKKERKNEKKKKS